jgi:serine/threonine-protein kinase
LLLTDNAAMQPGSFIGPYRIDSLLGVGGMGEVYRAQDPKLNRAVAIKILPPAFANDPDRLARFKREAQVLASLNHPNIAGIHGFEDSGDVQALVLELVDGPTLADRLQNGRLAVDEAIAIAKQIADALEAAHEQGIIHRDLKPANIKVRDDGTVKVLDFGLAKLIEPPGVVQAFRPASPGGPEGPHYASQSPTITTPAMTAVGMILGTAAYMSPEQAKGRPADKRSDLWAFGCVLYEMVTGSRAFEGDDVSDTLANVLKSEPDWSALPANLPNGYSTLVKGCLRKDRRERIGDISTGLFILRSPDAVGPVSGSAPPRPPLWRRAVPIVLSVLVGAAAATAMLWKPQPLPARATTRFFILLPEGQRLSLARQNVAISPDGTRIVYAADGKLFLRSMTETEPRAIPGTEGAAHPVFSPDSQSLAFWTDGALKRIAATGGTAVTICQITRTPSGITWTDAGILFAEQTTGIMRVSANGGKPEVVVALKDSEGLVHGPQLLPDGNTVLFTIAPNRRVAEDLWSRAQIVAQSLRTGERKTLIAGGDDGRYVSTGHLVYLKGGTLLAVPFDLAKLAVTGGPVPLVQGIASMSSASTGGGQFAFSNSGSLIYMPGLSGQQDLMLFDRHGASEPLKLPPRAYAYPRVSSDGLQIAFETSDGQQTNVSVYELSGATSPRRLTFGGNNRFPIWSADSRHVAFQSDRDGDLAVFWQPVDGGEAERLTKADPGVSHIPESWSPTADAFLFSMTKGLETSLWTFSLADRKATRFGDVTSTTLPTDAVFSPDGRWVAYQVGAGGQTEGTTYIQPFPTNGTKYEIARPGGRPLWSRDGTELFYIPAPGQLVAVTVKTQPKFSFTNPVAVPRGFGVADPSNPRPFDMLRDGRIIGVRAVGQAPSGALGSAEIQVVLNWFDELKQRVPTK